jgi:hypothetical protein
MKNLIVSFFVTCVCVFSVHAIVPPSDTGAADLSVNIVDRGDWSASQYKSTIDTLPSLAIPNPDSSIAEIKAHVTTLKANEATSDYPWVSVDCDLDSGKNFVGVTAVRLTYKADKAWYMGLTDTMLDPNNAAPYQAVLPAATAATTVYFNVADTSTKYLSTVTFTQPDWVETGYRTPIDYTNINGFTFAPNDDAGLGVESTIEIFDLRLYHYSGYSSSVRFNVKNQSHVSGSINLMKANVLSFSVPKTSTYAVSIYSPEGKLVAGMSKACSKDGRNEITLKNYSLAPGLYVARISQADYSAIGKIVIK